MQTVKCECGRDVTVYRDVKLRYIKLETLLKIRENNYSALRVKGIYYNAGEIEKEIDRKRLIQRNRTNKFKGRMK